MHEHSDDIWKSYHDSTISHSMAHYLMAIDSLCEEHKACRAASIARYLNISRNAVSLKIKLLQQNNLIKISDNHQISLSSKGLDAVNNIVAARRAMKRFLVNFLELKEDIAEQDSCKVEHLISIQMREGLMKLMQFVEECPDQTDQFIKDFSNFKLHCGGKHQHCPLCEHGCLL